ncbi:fatty-acid amide hydrolase 2 [Asbolus verrucosus]|uniref:Fatty-acid amide hydrolase 2 n=1 Tax=Asbolus verrucosus TaxID=1661398 RepID=A0A482VP60_ASBVE|nr:fatty-acid amide hydrolase 2 [Asbolus verrucosus]
MLPFIRYHFDLFIDRIFGLYYNSRVEPIQKATNDLVLESAVSLARKIRKREVTSEDVVRAFIDRIKEVNPLLNAVVDQRFNEAIKEAQNLDKDIASGAILDADFAEKPFLGVPFTTKESTSVKGMSNTFGLLKRKSRKALFDAEVIEKMKDSGAILIAVTNVPQLNLWQETRNPVYGLTNNPYNITRNVGGSSGGEASIIAACGSPLGVGTDIGGSLRIPSFMCGICAHKPTCNLVSTNGLTFRTGKEKSTMVVAGPMTKYVDDIKPFLKVLVGENVHKLKLDEPVNIKNIKIYYVQDPKDPFVSPFRDEMKQLMTKVVNHFNEILPYKPELLTINEFKYGGKIWRYWMSQEPDANFNRDLADREGEISSMIELIKFCLRRSEFNIAVMLNLINGLLPSENADWAKEQTNTLHNKLMAALGTDGVLLYPSAPWPASYHHTAIFRPWNLNLFAIWNAMKFPVTQVPLGLGKEGLPVGIQVVAAPYQDHLAIAVAKELEKTFGGYVPPFKVNK